MKKLVQNGRISVLVASCEYRMPLWIGHHRTTKNPKQRVIDEWDRATFVGLFFPLVGFVRSHGHETQSVRDSTQ